jgi:hypothetical protein
MRHDGFVIAAMQELRGLEALETDMSRNNATLRQRREMARVASTPFGRIQTLSGRVLAIYCVFRTLNVRLFPLHILFD